MNCLILNQLATPGLGTWIVGRRTEATGQLLLAVAGFLSILGWFAIFFVNQYRRINELPPRPGMAWLGWGGAALFAAAWCWSLVTSLVVLRSAARD